MDGYDDIVAGMKNTQAATGTAPNPYDDAAAALRDEQQGTAQTHNRHPECVRRHGPLRSRRVFLLRAGPAAGRTGEQPCHRRRRDATTFGAVR